MLGGIERELANTDVLGPLVHVAAFGTFQLEWLSVIPRLATELLDEASDMLESALLN